MPRNTSTAGTKKASGTASKTAGASSKGSGTASKTAAASSRPMAASKSNGAASKSNGSSQRSGAMTSSKSDETMLKELFVDELKDIYWAEKHLTKALPKMKKAATSQELANAFDQHLSVTENQIGRLEQVFELLDMPARAKKCEAMNGLVKEAQELMEELPKGTSVRDAGLIIAGQKVEHYEIAAYGSLVQLAKTMGQNEIADILQETLNEEKEADQLLSELAISGININADNETED